MIYCCSLNSLRLVHKYAASSSRNWSPPLALSNSLVFPEIVCSPYDRFDYDIDHCIRWPFRLVILFRLLLLILISLSLLFLLLLLLLLLLLFLREQETPHSNEEGILLSAAFLPLWKGTTATAAEFGLMTGNYDWTTCLTNRLATQGIFLWGIAYRLKQKYTDFTAHLPSAQVFPPNPWTQTQTNDLVPSDSVIG